MDRMNIEQTKFRNHKLLDNENIELEFCEHCNKITMHHEIYGIDEEYKLKDLISYKCLECEK